jgi:hypothetical protein
MSLYRKITKAMSFITPTLVKKIFPKTGDSYLRKSEENYFLLTLCT